MQSKQKAGGQSSKVRACVCVRASVHARMHMFMKAHVSRPAEGLGCLPLYLLRLALVLVKC